MLRILKALHKLNLSTLALKRASFDELTQRKLIHAHFLTHSHRGAILWQCALIALKRQKPLIELSWVRLFSRNRRKIALFEPFVHSFSIIPWWNFMTKIQRKLNIILNLRNLDEIVQKFRKIEHQIGNYYNVAVVVNTTIGPLGIQWSVVLGSGKYSIELTPFYIYYNSFFYIRYDISRTKSIEQHHFVATYRCFA